MKLTKRIYIPAMIFCAGVILRLLYLHEFSASPLFNHPLGPDVQEYDQWARKILVDGWLWHEPQIHAPLYPMFLSLLYRICNLDLMPVRFIQEMLVLISFIPLSLEMRRRTPNYSGLAELFWAFAALYPPLIYYSGELTSEALLLPLLNLALFFVWRGSGRGKQATLCIGFAGVCAGLAVITHPLSLAFVIALAAFVLWRNRRQARLRHKITGVTLYLVLLLVPVIPVWMYNSQLVSGRGNIQNNSGYNLYVGNSPKSTGGCRVRPGPQWDQLHYEAELKSSRMGISKDQVFANTAYRFMQEQPGAFLLLLVKKSIYVWNWHEMPAGADSAPLRYYTTMQQFTKWSFGIIAALALTGFYLILSRRRDRVCFLIFLLPVAAYWGALTFTVVSARYRLPLLPGLFLGAAFVLVEIYRRRGNISSGAKIFGTCAVCLVFLVPPPKTDFENSESDSLLGEAYYRQGDMITARQYLNRAVISEPWSRSLCLLGAVEKNLGNRKRAADLFAQGAKASPNDPMGQMNLGIMASEENRWPQAEWHFQVALRLAGDNPETLYNFAVFRMKQNRLTEAGIMLKKALDKAPAHRQSLNQLGVCMMKQGKYNAAIGIFTTATILDPDNEGLAFNLAAAYLASGRKEKAREILERILSGNPGNVLARRLKELILKKAGEGKKARKY